MNLETTGAWTAERAREFAARWLPAWTGNRPEELAAYYTDDVYYSDPVYPAGLRGKDALLAYFRKLLAANPDWVWTQREAVPMAGGFVNFWRAEIPVDGEVKVCDGVCLVFLEGDRIRRNEVFFDRGAVWPARR